MSKAPELRRSSFAWLALAGVPPAIGWWAVERERNAFRSIYGMDPEGVAQFGIVAIAAFATLVILAIAALYSIRAVRALEPPRPFFRLVEVTVFCLPLVAMLTWAILAIGVLQHDTPQVIHID